MIIFTLDGEVLVFIVASDSGPPKAVRSHSSSLVLGSSPDCDVVVREAAGRHVKIERNGKVVTLDDLESPGGTFVNGTPLDRGKRRELHDGDLIELAKGAPGATLVFVVPGGVPPSDAA